MNSTFDHPCQRLLLVMRTKYLIISVNDISKITRLTQDELNQCQEDLFVVFLYSVKDKIETKARQLN